MIRSKIKNNSALGGSKPAVHTALSLTNIKITAFICRQAPGGRNVAFIICCEEEEEGCRGLAVLIRDS